LPELFDKNDLSILPISRGSYVISHFEAYKNFQEQNSEIIEASFPDYIESIDYQNITSEATAINAAYVSGILSDFLEDSEILPTVSGRMGSNVFSYNIRNIKKGMDVSIRVENSQVEIDGGYEGLRYLTLLEAKNTLSEDFLIRQLYYPYRLWSNNIRKTVKPVFMTYSNSVFSLYEYCFEDVYNYNSLVLVKQKNYSFESVEITLSDIIDIINRAKIIREPEVPFPQADSFKRVINLLELLYERDRTKDEITTNYAFDERQSNYYTDAGRYLGLINKRRESGAIVFSLSSEGRKILNLRYHARQLRFVELILSHKAFNETLRKHLQYGEMPKKEEVVHIMENSELYKVEARSTFERRRSTITGWVNWILELQR
jgi:hypothetical protein